MATIGNKRPLDSDESNDPVSKKIKSDNRSFKDVWLSEFMWLDYNAKSKTMYCKICIQFQKSNSFTSGCSMLKKDNISKHEKSKGNKKEWQSLILKCIYMNIFYIINNILKITIIIYVHNKYILTLFKMSFLFWNLAYLILFISDHKEASQAWSLKTSMTNAQAAAISKSEAAVVSAMTNVYFAAQHTLASSLVPDLNRLCVLQVKK